MSLVQRVQMQSAGRSGVMPATIGAVWSVALLLFGLALCETSELAAGVRRVIGEQPTGALAVMSVAGAQFMFMELVADRLCPAAPQTLSRICKLMAAVALWAALAWGVWATWRALRGS